MFSQNKIFSFKIKRQAKNVFPSNVEKTIEVLITQPPDASLTSKSIRSF